MRLSYRYIELHLRHTFTIARSSRDIEPCIIVELEHDGVIGYGESAPSERYGESAQTVLEFLKKVDLARFNDPFRLEEILLYVNCIAPGNTSAKAAIDIALHDWVGKKLGVPLWKFWGLAKEKTPVTSFTIGIDSLEMIEQKVKEAAPYPILKVKVGVPNDREIIRKIRQVTDKTIRVDANEGWKSRDQALDTILWLEEQGIEFVEQPLSADCLDDTAWLREHVHIPLVADENVTQLFDLPRLSGVFDGINIKLMKCTGLREAMRMIHTAQSMNMKIMLGCMIESSVAISAATHLSPLVDYADLDGNILITDDPFEGIDVVNGKLMLNDRPGLGVAKRSTVTEC
ncbi:MAG: dipeptide epimerase [Ignavibacteria bacterium]|nr:dipeptide epimerase [Ignavibacteria bacterium]MBI3765484.1 dipeptide epimerase [Ignavibacteriales bacterium]